MAKKTNRTKEQQEYRDNLAQGLKQLRNEWEVWKDLAITLLEDGKSIIEYLDSLKGSESDYLNENWEWTETMENSDEDISNQDLPDDLTENWEWKNKPSGMALALNPKKDIITPVLYENPHMKSTLQKISTTDLQETADSIISGGRIRENGVDKSLIVGFAGVGSGYAQNSLAACHQRHNAALVA